MDNPWKDLPETAPFVLKADREIIAEYNRRKGEEDRHRIHLEPYPEPFLGNHNAQILLLNSNPGFEKGDIAFFKENEYWRRTCEGNLRHHPAEYPFYPLDPKNSSSGGYRWWSGKILKSLLTVYGVENVSRNLFCVEFFPYHFEEFAQPREILPSQKYGFHLVERAMRRQAVIIIMRKRKLWQDHVSGLRDYGECHCVTNYRRPWITEGNLKSGFGKIRKILGGS